MKIRVNLWLTIFLFIMMLSAGIASSFIGYFMGREALKVVTQPDISTQDIPKSQRPLGGEYKGLKMIKEQDILTKVYDQIHAESR